MSFLWAVEWIRNQMSRYGFLAHFTFPPHTTSTYNRKLNLVPEMRFNSFRKVVKHQKRFSANMSHNRKQITLKVKQILFLTTI